MRHMKFRGLLVFLAGAFAALPVVLTQLSFLAFVSLTPFAFLLFSELTADTLPFRPRRYYGTGLSFCMGYFIVAFHWFVYLYPLDFVEGMTPFLAILIILLACIGLPLLQSAGFAFLFWGMAHLSRTRMVRRVPLLLPFLLAAGWTVFAFTQTLTWAGVPFGAQLALSQQKNLLFLSSASFFGSYFVTFIIGLCASLLGYALLFLRSARRRAATVSLIACGVFLLNFGLSAIAYFRPLSEESTVSVAVLQGNFSSSEKWSSGGESASVVYLSLAREAAEAGAELIVWPETAITSHLQGGSVLRERIKSLAVETGTYQVVGAFSYTPRDGKTVRQNSLYLFTPSGEVGDVLYHKRHLVPFGEFVPMENLIRTLFPALAGLEMLKDGTSLVAGDSAAIFETPIGDLGGLICFDTIYEGLARDSAASGAELFVIGTNDSWFFDSAAVYMHNGQAILRAVENNRAVARAANTGISSIITPKGESLKEIEPLVRGFAVAEIPLEDGMTLYTQIGDVFVLLCQLFILSPFAFELFLYIKRRIAK